MASHAKISPISGLARIRPTGTRDKAAIAADRSIREPGIDVGIRPRGCRPSAVRRPIRFEPTKSLEVDTSWVLSIVEIGHAIDEGFRRTRTPARYEQGVAGIVR